MAGGGVWTHGNVEGREYGNEAGDHSPEEERVPPHVVHPLGEVFFASRLHTEEAAAHVDHLPGQEEGEPSERHKGGCAGPEDGVTCLRVGVVAALAEIAVAETVDDQQKRGKAKGCHPEAVYKLDLLTLC